MRRFQLGFKVLCIREDVRLNQGTYVQYEYEFSQICDVVSFILSLFDLLEIYLHHICSTKNLFKLSNYSSS